MIAGLVHTHSAASCFYRPQTLTVRTDPVARSQHGAQGETVENVTRHKVIHAS